MDARPYRPRGAENVPPLQHRHKSTGNLATMAAAPSNGFRGPAKRAAFGDVTNLSKAVGIVREEAKSGKSQVNLNNSGTQIHKENSTYTKDAFARPAQRPAGLGSKLKVAADTKPPQPVTKASRPATENFHEYNIVSTSYESSSLQPRHHKSQPQLKTQEPHLRRTQSKQMAKTFADLEESEASHATVPGPSHAHGAYIDTLYLSRDQDCYDQVNEEADHIELPSKLSDISEEKARAHTYKEGSLPALSEPEECWDEDDDEDYDDQDQAYTTAHSFKSRDMTTGGATVVVPPQITARVQRELEEAQLEVERTRTDDDVEEELWDVSMVAEYGDEIFEYMRDLELKMTPNPHYMDLQTEIQWSMRSVLMDWLVQVHSRFGLLPETLFLTVNYIDRFLSSKIVSIGKLQLVGATAILVASKYEEINCPSLQEIVFMVDHGYTTEEILKAERFMLSMLNFELGWPGPMSFLRRVSKADDYDLDTRTLAKYFLELTIMDERFVASPPSFLAAGAHCLSRLILNKGDWTKHHVHYSGYTWSQLRSLVTMMLECCEHPRLHHAAVFEKYSDKRFKEASLLVQSALDAGFTLPQFSSSLRSLKSGSAHLESDALHANSLISIEG